MKKISLLFSVAILCSSYGPPNCNLYKDDPECYQACKEAEQAIMHAQGSKASQEHFDRSIALCPTFDYSFYEKSVPYAKRGQIADWKVMIDQAMQIDSAEYLAVRGWYHYFFMHNFKESIKDIEKLDELKEGDIGTTGDAIYHLNLLKGLAYYNLGELEKAIEIFEKQLAVEDHFVSLYDRICLGRLYLLNEQYDKAIEQFKKQAETNDIAENHYYLSLTYLKLEKAKEALIEINIAKEYYSKGKDMENSYRELPFEIYAIDIENALAEIKNTHLE